MGAGRTYTDFICPDKIKKQRKECGRIGGRSSERELAVSLDYIVPLVLNI